MKNLFEKPYIDVVKLLDLDVITASEDSGKFGETIEDNNELGFTE